MSSASVVCFFNALTCFFSDVICACSERSVGPLFAPAPAPGTIASDATAAIASALRMCCLPIEDPCVPRSYSGAEQESSAGLERTLQLEQRPLAVDPSRVAHERAARAHDAMARQHDRNGVAVHHGSDRPRRP